MPARRGLPVDLTLTLAGDYGIRAMLDLARHPCGFRKRREIAAACEIPQTLLPRVLSTLVSAGLITAEAGPRGGYRLVRGADDISVLDVIVAVEGPPKGTQCLLFSTECDASHPCDIHGLRLRAQEAASRELMETKLADLVGQ